jgi:pimeloyl-ACP methyl ester carboxylesterase
MTTTHFAKFNSGPAQQNRIAIVFVHGFSGDLRATWGEIPALLESSGRLPGWDLYGFGYSSKKRFDLLGLWSADPALEQIAEKLTTTLELEAKNYRFAFIAHSMGGLVVQRALAMKPELRSSTTHMIMFGTPSGGLVKAQRASWFKQQARDMAAGGAFVTALREEWTSLKLDTTPPFHFLTVAGEMDQFVDPHSSLDPFPKAVQRVIPGNHLSMLDAESVAAPCLKIILESLTSDSAGSGVRSAASVAVDAGDFQAAIDRLWPGRDQLDDRGAVQLAIALDRKRRRDEAIELLRAHKALGTDVLGVLGGLLKRRWLLSSSAQDFDNAMELYRKGYETSIAKDPPDHDQAFYHGINIAYLLLAGSVQDLPEARKIAQSVLDHCAKSSNPRQPYWRPASEGDALMILGRAQEGFEKHREAVAAKPGPRAWEALSMEEQALRVAELSGVSREDGAKVAAIYEGTDK